MNRFSLLLLICLPFGMAAQPLLSLDDALDKSLLRSYDIQIARNNAGVAAQNATREAAGFWPEINLNGNATYGNISTRQEFANGQEQKRNFAQSYGANANATAVWVLYNGRIAHKALERLEAQAAQGDAALDAAVENSVASVLQAYSDAVRQQGALKALAANLSLFEDRASIARTRWEIGAGSKLDYLQAEVDLSAQRAALLRQEQSLLDAKDRLRLLLVEAPDGADFAVSDTLELLPAQAFDELWEQVQAQQSNLRIQQYNIQVAEQLLSETRAAELPRVTLNSSYSYGINRNQAGFLFYNRNVGLNSGLNITWNLFDAGRNRRLISNAEMSVASERLRYDQLKDAAYHALFQAWSRLRNAKAQLSIERRGAKLAEENARVALESFRLGGIGALELRQAQTSYESALLRLVNAHFDAQSAQLDMLRQTGALVRR